MESVLLIDRTGRGHALADALIRTNSHVMIHYAPGCEAISHPRINSYPNLSVLDFDPLVALASRVKADLVIVSNTFGLVGGCADVFRNLGYTVVGPSEAACKLESSKVEAKAFFSRHGVSQGEFQCFDNPHEAAKYVGSVPFEVVVKADGLCFGNGVFVCNSKQDAYDAIDRILVSRQFGEAGKRVVIEERLYGTEFSYFGLIDGEHFVALPMAFDYPRSGDGDTGLTCAGVGSLRPHHLDTPNLRANVEARIVRPVLRGIREDRLCYIGPIYFGCMLVGDDAFLLEINIRLGDPESQAILPSIQADFYDVCRRTANRELAAGELQTDSLSYCAVTAFQGPTAKKHDGTVIGKYTGWPTADYGKGYEISGLDSIDTSVCSLYFGPAIRSSFGRVVTDGGRPLTITGFGDSMTEARRRAYENIKKIQFEGMTYRSDIGVIQPT